MNSTATDFDSKVKMENERYACSNQLLQAIRDLDFDFAIFLIKNREYSRWSIHGKKRYFSKLSMPVELSSWLQGQYDMCEDSL